MGSFFTRILQRQHARSGNVFVCAQWQTVLVISLMLYWPLLCFLLAAACLTVVFVFTAQSLCVTEVPGGGEHVTGGSVIQSHSHQIRSAASPFSCDWMYNKSNLPETVCYWCVLLHIHRKIQKILIFAAHLSEKEETWGNSTVICFDWVSDHKPAVL